MCKIPVRTQYKCYTTLCIKGMKISKVEFWNSPMLWTTLKTVLKTMSKFQSMSKITVTWPLHDPFHQFWNILTVIKIKSDIINEDYGPYGVTCQVWLKCCVFLQGKFGLFVGNSCMICMLWKICFSTLLWTFFIFFQIESIC